MPRNKAPGKKQIRILVIRFSSIGDIALTTSLLHSLKAGYPGMVMDYLTFPEYGLLLKDNPYIDNLYFHDRNRGALFAARNAVLLNKNNYDYIFDLHKSMRSIIYRSLIRAANKRVLSKNYIKRFLLINFKLNFYKKPYSVVERYFKTADALKVRPVSGSEIWIDINEYNACIAGINNLLNTRYGNVSGNRSVKIEKPASGSGNKAVCIMPFAGWKTKEWGDERFAGLAAKIVSEKGITVFVLGGKEDMTRAEHIAAIAGDKAIALAGKLNLAEASVLLSMSACLVTNDTGIMHIGSAVLVPVIAIFGSTTEELGFFPYEPQGEVVQSEIKCRPCTAKGLDKCPEKHFRCMSDISVDSVYSVLEKYI